MKEIMKKIMVDAIKRYLPLIINALCAGVCLTATGCAICSADKVTVEVLPTYNKGL